MAKMKWFRLYSEILHDRKLARIARREMYPKYQLIGIWVSLLCIANDSPERGKLMLSENVPMDLEDIAFEISMSADEFDHLMEVFVIHDMMNYDGKCYEITQWSKRQFKSDDGYERVQRFREKQAKIDETVQVENSETFQKRIRNGNETPPDTDTDTDTDTEKSILSAPAAEYVEILKSWGEIFPEKPQPRTKNKTLQGKTKTRMSDAHFKENWKEAMERAGKSSFIRQSTWFTLQWFLKNDDNYTKCLDGNYDDRASAYSNSGGYVDPTSVPNVSGRI